MSEHCHSCAAPLAMPDFKGPAKDYCKYCTDDTGKLKPKSEVQKGIAGWMMSWQPGLTEQLASGRASLYMKSMPAWVEK